MKIRQFKDTDLKEAGEMAYNYWSDEVPQGSDELKHIIYEYMVRYYDRNRALSYSIENENGLKGFLLTFRKSDLNRQTDWLQKKQEYLSQEEKALVIGYQSYLDYNGHKIKEYIHDNAIILGLFISTEKGGGKMLFQHLQEECKLQNIANAYLWTDTTCNFNYYYHNNFEEITRFDTNELFKDENFNLTTILFKKKL